MARNLSIARGSSRRHESSSQAAHSGSHAGRAFLAQCLFCSAAALIFVLLLVSSLGAQSSLDDEVHIAPPPSSKAPHAIAAVDPELRTYTEPIVKEVDLVLVPVTVTDYSERLVTGLEKHNFEVLEHGKKQDIRYFSSEDAPISLGVVFDTSSSMAEKIDESREAIVEFFKTGNPEDECFVVTFSDTAHLLQDFTTRVDDIQNRLIDLVPNGKTALLDAIDLGIKRMREARYPRKALLIISDGGDNHSRYSEGEIKSLVREADVQVYAIGLADRVPRTPEEQFGPTLLSEITDVTGGRTFMIDNAGELPDVASKIAMELRNQYVLAYRPSNPAHDGKWRKIKVKLLPPKGLPPLHIHAKTGYYAPQD